MSDETKMQAEQDAEVVGKFRTALKNAAAVRFAPEEVRDQVAAEVDGIATHPDIAFHLIRHIDRLADEINQQANALRQLEIKNKHLMETVARSRAEVKLKGATPSAGRKAIETRIKVLQMVCDGLAGKPFRWGTVGETSAYMKLAREMGVNLHTRNQIAEAGHELSPRAKPVGDCNFGNRFAQAALYVLGAQTKEKATTE